MRKGKSNAYKGGILKGRFEQEQRLFIIAKLGRAKDVDCRQLKKMLPAVKRLGIHALSVGLSDNNDWRALSYISPAVKKHHIYLLGELQNPLSRFFQSFCRLFSSQIFTIGKK